MTEDNVNIPKLIVFIVGLGIVSYAFFVLGSRIREGINVELKKTPLRPNIETRRR